MTKNSATVVEAVKVEPAVEAVEATTPEATEATKGWMAVRYAAAVAYLTAFLKPVDGKKVDGEKGAAKAASWSWMKAAVNAAFICGAVVIAFTGAKVINGRIATASKAVASETAARFAGLEERLAAADAALREELKAATTRPTFGQRLYAAAKAPVEGVVNVDGAVRRSVFGEDATK